MNKITSNDLLSKLKNLLKLIAMLCESNLERHECCLLRSKSN